MNVMKTYMRHSVKVGLRKITDHWYVAFYRLKVTLPDYTSYKLQTIVRLASVDTFVRRNNSNHFV